jgi:Ca-activated chloride channel family protein
MEWQYPQWLYLILPLAAAWLALAVYSRQKRRRAAEAFVAQPMWPRILPADSPARFWMKWALRETALVAGLVALAGPRFGTQLEDVIPRGSDLYVLIDVSRSMLAQDVPPSRLGRAKADVAALLNRLEGERVGLIAFAGAAVVKCPLTVDYDAFRRSLDELDPASAPRGGTAIGDAIRKALEVFQARSDRDQAILLITDGDDQQSYPLEAASVAAERHVTIFTVGLGDADHGARIPQGAEAKSFVEYKGQQVWSKLDGSLLKDIALKTSGVYVPAGTRAYDLGELYAKYLQGRRGSQEESHKRIRRAEQFQLFLAIALLALLADALIRPYPAIAQSATQGLEARSAARPKSAARVREAATPVSTLVALVVLLGGTSRADDPKKGAREGVRLHNAAEAIREGLRLYAKGEFDQAKDSFAAAREQFDQGDAARAAIAAFDQACALHKKGDLAGARESYLKAGLARDKKLAASAHYNLGTLSAEEARRLAGASPEDVAPEKRSEILDQVKAAVASFRHCLDLEPENPRARRDVELLRQWVKYYGDRWQARDREKRRQETNLVAFLEFLIETQRALREAVKALPAPAPADAFAEPKRLQEELLEEIPPLKEKIKTELSPQPQPSAVSGSQPQLQQPPQGQPNAKEIERGITMLQGWADAAGQKMSAAAHRLDERQAVAAASEEQSAIDELEKIWDAVIPFHPLLARDLADQTTIARSLAPPSAGEASAGPGKSAGKTDSQRADAKPAPRKAAPSAGNAPPASAANSGAGTLGSESESLAPLVELEQRTSRRTQLLKLKAEAELERLEKLPPEAAARKGQGPAAGPSSASRPIAPPATGSAQAKPADPREIKAGYQKAIELAPKAVEQMEVTVKSLKPNDARSAYAPAEEARKILEEIQKAQPKNKEPDQKQQDQDKKKNQDQPKKDQQKDQEKKDQEKKEQQKKDQEKDQQKKDQEKKKQDEPNKSDEQKAEQKQQKDVSSDRIEEALRKVRERQQEKRERDRMLKARLLGAIPVEKDW